MKTRLRMKCPNCGYWNRFPVNINLNMLKELLEEKHSER